ncbi:unnamed protein product, partial [Effrenium voratum]
MSDCALPAPCDGLEEWIEDRQRAVDSCFKNRSAWSDLDCRVWQHDYNPNVLGQTEARLNLDVQMLSPCSPCAPD